MKNIRSWFWLLCLLLSALNVQAQTYNLSAGEYPPASCSTSWSSAGTTHTCTGNGRVTLPNGVILTSNTTITIVANNGFSLSNNTLGSATNNINLQADYNNVISVGTNTINGNITANSSQITLAGTTVTGTITTGGNISLTGGSVGGQVTSTSNTITTNGTNLQGGARAQSGMTITGGTIAGNFVMTSNNQATFSGVTMTSGSISGASTVNIQGGSTLGGPSSSITISSNSGPINVTNNSTVYGALTAPNWSTVNIATGGTVFGTCIPGSTPANACNAVPPSCPGGGSFQSGIAGSYFTGTSLSGTPVGMRVDSSVDFNWAAGSPGVTGIGVDQFSVRWEGYLRVTVSGNYRFQTLSDDGVRLWVNNNQVINNWTDHGATTNTSGNMSLMAGQVYPIRLEYYENGGQSEIRLRWEVPGSGFVTIPAGPSPTLGAGLYHCSDGPQQDICPMGSPGTAAGGLLGAYFTNMNLSGSPAANRVDGPVDFNWDTGATGMPGIPADQFSARWEGRLRAPSTGTYQFQTESDDGVRLWVNGQLLIDQWNDHSATAHTSGDVTLYAGQVYDIRLEYYENLVHAVIRLRWRIPGSGSFVPIPAGPVPTLGSGLYHCAQPPSVAYYTISHSGSGVTCEAEPVSITAYGPSGNPVAPPANTTAILSTSPATGVWVGGNSYVFSGTEHTFVKYLQQLTPATLNINVTDGTASELPAADPHLVFADTGLRFYGLPELPASMVAGVTYNGATLRAVRTNNETGACEGRVVDNRSVGLAYECRNPLICSAGQDFLVNGMPAAANGFENPVNYNNVNLSFDANGTAQIPLNFTDVGLVQLHARLNLAAQGNDPAITLSGSSSEFVVKPYTLVVIDPIVADASQGFVAAGEHFSVQVQAQNAEGNPAPNFGNEISSQVGGVSLAIDSLVYPVGGDEGELAGAGAGTFISAGSGTAVNHSVSWNEVGSITLVASLGDYLSAGGLAEQTPSDPIGRYYPDHFALISSTLGDSCSGFSYMSHSAMTLEYELQANNANAVVTRNYHYPGYANTAGVDYVAENNNDGNDLSGRLSFPSTTWDHGVMQLDVTNAAFLRQTPDAPEVPFQNMQFGIRVLDTLDNRLLQNLNMNPDTDDDCVAANHCTAALLDGGKQMEMRYGRMHARDAFGPEFAPIPMFWQTEYWNGTRFVLSSDDTCTELPVASITFVDSAGAPNQANSSLTVTRGGIASVFDFSNPVLPSLPGGFNDDASAIRFHGGLAGIQYGAPGAPVIYPIRVSLTGLPHLQYDWNQQDGSDEWLPTFEIRFSHYRGHDRVIYWREDLR